MKKNPPFSLLACAVRGVMSQVGPCGGWEMGLSCAGLGRQFAENKEGEERQSNPGVSRGARCLSSGRNKFPESLRGCADSSAVQKV